MKATELIPVPYSKITLNSFEVGSLPCGGHGYILTDESTEILFIGATKRLDHTVNLHSRKFAKLKEIEGKIDCYFIACSSEEEFSKIEKNWMGQHRKITGKLPSCNVSVNT